MGKWKGIVGRSFTPEEFRQYVAGLNWGEWLPEFIVLHNTEGLTVPGGLSEKYIRDMEHEYRDLNGWSAGPHLFLDSERIWVFTPLTTPGVHANSWNSRTLGVEMEGDYDREKFNSGRGLLVQRNAVAAVAILSEALNMDPNTLMFHKENGETEHDCPGVNVRKADIIRAVQDYLAGETPAAQVAQPAPAIKPAPEHGSAAPGAYDFSTKEGAIAAIRAECQKQGIGSPEQIAYVLATVDWETGHTFKPVREAFWKDEEWRRRNLSRYYPHYGRGYVQLTWEANYRKYSEILGIDLVNNPDLAMVPATAAFILVHGFRTGAFTGMKITNYINDDGADFYNARRCINGVEAEEIAAIAEKFLEA